MKPDFWELLSIKEDWIFESVNAGMKAKFLLNPNQRKVLANNKRIKGLGKGRDTYIILNGPSLKTQDLSKLKGESTIFVNMGFKHPMYEELQPEFHVIVDPKLNTGEWPITILDEILEKSPNVSLVLNAKWAQLDKFKPYAERCPIVWINQDLYWNMVYKSDIDITKPINGFAVFGTCFNVAVYMGFTNIFFTGFDANGLAYEIVNQSSHFYGINEDNLTKTSKDFSRDLFMMHRGLRTLNMVGEYCRNKGINITNLTNGGMLDMFPRREF